MVSGALVALALVVPAAAGGEPRPSVPVQDALSVTAGATCLDDATLAMHLTMWLERDAVDAAIKIEVEGDGEDPHRARFVVVRDERATSPRTLDRIPDDCNALHAALALAIAVAVDASVGELFAPDPAPVSPPRESAPGKHAVPASVPVPRDPVPVGLAGAAPAPRLGVHSRFGGIFAVGLTDGPAYGGVAGLTLNLPHRLDLEVAARGIVGPHGTLGTGHVRTILVLGEARICARLDPARVRVRACAMVGAGAQQITGLSFERPLSTTLPWVGVGPGLGVAYPRDALVALGVQVDLWVPLLRTRVVGLGNAGEVLAAKPLPLLGASATIGAIFRLR